MIFLDTETNGLNFNKIIELAYINDKERYEKRYSLNEGEHIEIEAMAIHHITEKMLNGLPTFEKSEDYEELKQKIENDILVCHNTKYDYDIVLKWNYGFTIKDRICTLKVAKTLLPESKKHNLQFLRYYFWLEFDERIDPHAAISDVIVLKWVYEALFKLAKEKFPEKTDEEITQFFIDIEKNPVLLENVWFWKHKWEKFKDLPKEYLDWLIKINFDNEDVLYTAKHYLEKLNKA